MRGITVREIAERIKRPNEDLTNVVDRLRNWTDENLITPLGELNPGTGKKRLYSESALIEALVLSVLTDAVGMRAVKGRSFVKLFRIAKQELRSDLTSSAGAKGRRFLVIGLSGDGSEAEIGTAWAAGLHDTIGSSKHDAQIVIDLGKLHERLRFDGEE